MVTRVLKGAKARAMRPRSGPFDSRAAIDHGLRSPCRSVMFAVAVLSAAVALGLQAGPAVAAGAGGFSVPAAAFVRPLGGPIPGVPPSLHTNSVSKPRERETLST